MIGKSILSSKVKTMFLAAFSLPFLPPEITVEKNTCCVRENYYRLSYPYKSLQKRHPVVRPYSCLYLDCFLLKCQSPLLMIQFVSQMRERGIHISMCLEELEKAKSLAYRREIACTFSSPLDLVEYYAPNPTDFEHFCAELFTFMGYTAVVTPPSNDGGYDIKLYSGQETVLVECKCYAPDHKVDRPLIQKLVGANQKEAANRMFFVTTSSFTRPAVEFAAQVHVELISGEDLILMLQNGDSLSPSRTCQSWYLTAEDLMKRVPKDLIYYL